MIDLSYLTEDEQGAIMAVLRRDADLKKAEEERIRKLERIPDSRSQLDTELKYRTGEWFYEAKSHRHMDTIHGSEIILASMKQREAGLDGSLRIERSKTASSRGSDIAAPPKPARCLEALQPQEINNAEKEDLNSAFRSPRTPRHNPFNRTFRIVVQPPENNDDMSTSRDQESSETEPISPLKSPPAQSSQTSGDSLTSEGSSVGSRPVPKKRTFRSRRTSRQSESNGVALDALGETAGIAPSPRRSLQRRSNENSNQSYLKGQDEIPQKSVVSHQVSHSAQPSKPLHENSQQRLWDVSQLSSNYRLKRERNPPLITRDRLATYTRSDSSTDKEIPQKNIERDEDVVLHTGRIQDSDLENNSSVGTAMRPGDLSLPQSTVDQDPPVSYDLNFIDKSDQLAQKKSNKKNAFQLSTQATSPTGDEGDSIAKSRKQNADKDASPRRSPEDTETLTPRARAYVPTDYRHYLGMTDEASEHTSLAPALKDDGSEEKSRYEFDLAGSVRTSTPVSLVESYSSGGGKTSQRPLWTNYSSSDAGQESSVSSTSETWSNPRSSNRENDVDIQNLVRKALQRAEVRPRNLTKSMEDITASLSPRQETRQDPAADMRRIRDVSSIPSPSPCLFSDPEHLKKMSKSVPSFLEKEDVGRNTDSTCEDSDRTGRLMAASSLNNLSSSSGMSSLSYMSGSVMTMDSGDFGNVEVQGNIHFSINYIQKLKQFHIFVTKCQDLAAVDPKRGRSDPYVKSYLVPDRANLGKRKTSVKKKTRNPTFNEILRYRVRMEYLRTQTLILSVWHHDTFGRNSFLGEVDVDLSKWDFDHTQINYFALKARTTPTLAPSHGRGEMRLAIRFLPEIIHSDGLIKGSPNTGEVHIWVKGCKNLPPIRATIDPYVKCSVLPDTSRKSRQHTRVVRRTVDPVFNHTMVYDGIRQADLSEACVELTVWDQDRLASNLLGGLRLGVGKGRSYGALVDWMDSTPHEAALWERMIANPNDWVEDELPLRVLNSAKTGFK
ncbi:hypothetical protein VZT92_020855 [Zoarces viviparus]|uniref:Synaptotagmin-like protein 2 n=1 Tax=Zoarces viviparus TaxID=48416 RepID=A0AAW1EGN4_ZOAVI